MEDTTTLEWERQKVHKKKKKKKRKISADEQESVVFGDANGSQREEQATTEQLPVARKKHKKSSKTKQESTQSDSAEKNLRNKTQSTPKQSPDVRKESKGSPAKMAPMEAPVPPQSPLLKREWSDDQEHRLLKNVNMYASKLSGRERHSQRVNWSEVEKVDDFTEVFEKIIVNRLLPSPPRAPF